ncbi:MAG: ArgE/DapE family deacylase [Liquorilactobacillus nagelii]|jgi:succinyl-diaminopimelate desuccinylase|uniref:Probable succinyl-diaminopimelate desuccinylase n=2 Tax=Liquorilactobacillus nagelii TaxID=82688 RepID=A0A3S6QY07_9LACO|nr:ArgE/DapE family deacylase [Liquorilactobacillus nagelii]AUJ32984.1 succinyl-diaminopimelate desuccinylase [Liquorilactobacillus nagelii]MCC7616590.1 succinyl-diaminopimelate desuccinylase [Liquorilactobacillus nagelii]MCI1700486.1 ArgE/DapE family deacylase [Liquorilactobacillus nagelii]MCP9315224.1 ArgE/DapE family deacylase [Liquorilactobacillus nagelii]
MKEQAKIEILQKLIRIKTVNNNEAEAADYLASLFEPYSNAKVERLTYAPNRDNLIVTIGETGPILGFSGHLDVVAPGDLNAWDSDPFEPVIKQQRLYGRGAADMKSGLAALVVAMLELLESKQPLSGRIRLLATVGEETGEYGAAQLTKAGYADNLIGLIVAEPTSDLSQLVYTARGVIDYRITSIGKAAHSARPQFGVNAIDNLMLFYQQVKARFADFTAVDPVLGGITHNITKISGGEQVNSIPSYAELWGNIRTIPAYPNQVFYDKIAELLAELNQQSDVKLAVEYSFPEEAIPGDPQSPIIKAAQLTAQEVLGRTFKIAGSSGANDGAEFLQAKGTFNSIEIGPGSDSSHQSNEYVELPIYLQAIEFYQKFALEFLKFQTN